MTIKLSSMNLCLILFDRVFIHLIGDACDIEEQYCDMYVHVLIYIQAMELYAWL